MCHLQCTGCNLNFDNEQRLCKILPCSCAICLACVQVLGQRWNVSLGNSKDVEKEEFPCSKCNQMHDYAILNENLETSQIICNVLKSQAETNSNNSQSFSIAVKKFIGTLSKTVDKQKSVMLKRQETIVKEIDDAALRFIEVKTENGKFIFKKRVF